jgi:hypothetical protein
MKIAVLALSLLAAPAYAQVCPVGAPDDTAAIQSAVNAQGYVKLEYGRTYCLNARTGVRIPSDRTLDLTGATVGIFPGCTQHCKAFETVPGSSNVRVIGGTIIGDLTPAVGFSIGFRGDSVTGLVIEGTTFKQWRIDGIWLGGNLGTNDARISGVVSEEFGRNGLSIVNGARITVERSLFRNALQPSILGAGIDVEPNPGDRVTNLTIVDSEASWCVVGFYLHAGRGYQGYGFKLLNSRAWHNSKYGIILNSTQHAALLDNHVVASPVSGQPAPVGIAIGATGPITADDVIHWGNRVEGTARAVVIAGIKDSYIAHNELGIGAQQIVAPSATVPGMAGLMLFTP